MKRRCYYTNKYDFIITLTSYHFIGNKSSNIEKIAKIMSTKNDKENLLLICVHKEKNDVENKRYIKTIDFFPRYDIITNSLISVDEKST